MSYLPQIAWSTIINDVVYVSSRTYRITIFHIDVNEIGSPTIDVGYYLKDYVGYTYSIIEINVDGDNSHINVYDDFNVGYGPQSGQIAFIYKSVADGDAPYLAPIRHKKLDESALDYTRSIELDVIWKHRGFSFGSNLNITNIDLVGLSSSIDVNSGWYGGSKLSIINNYTTFLSLNDTPNIYPSNTLPVKITNSSLIFENIFESNITLSDNTINNASSSNHGFSPKLINDTSKYYRSDGSWSIIATSSGDFLDSVISMQIDNTLNPETPVNGNRYIILNSSNLNSGFGSINKNISGSALSLGNGDIVQYISSSSEFRIAYDSSAAMQPATVTVGFDKNGNSNHDWTYNVTTDEWVDRGSATLHNSLSDLNTGSGQYYHLTSSQLSGLTGGTLTMLHTHNYLSSFTETDPIFTAWNKSTGIIITKSQVSDLGSYEAPLTFSTGLTRTGNTVTNNITQYTDALARSAQNIANTSTTGLLTSSDWNTFNNKQPALGFTPYNATNPNNYIPLTSLSSSATGLTYNNTTGVFSLSSGYAIPTTANISTWNGLTSFPGFGTSHITSAYGDHNHSGIYEPVFTKNTAFNKNFGTSTTQVWGYDAHPTTLSGYGISDTPWTGYLPLAGGILTGALTGTNFALPSNGQLFLGATNSIFGDGNNNINFYTADTQRVRISNDGSLNINNVAGANIIIDAGVGCQSSIGFYKANTAKWALQSKGDGTDNFRFYNYANGEVFLITPTGTATFSGSVAATSFNSMTGLSGSGSATTVSHSDHNHTGTYQPLAAVLTNTTASYTTAEQSKLAGIAVGATNVTNTNQLTNGAGFITSLSGAVLANGTVGLTANWNAGAATYSITAANFILGSDRRYKRDIKAIDYSGVDQIKFVQYSMKSDSTNHKRYGVIAQDVEKTNPELVYTDEKGGKSVAYIDLLIKKIAELEERIKSLENEK